MATPNYIRPRGGLVLDRFDADAHFNGTKFRHNSNQIDVSPSVTINGQNIITVAAALSVLASYVSQDILAGAGFITLDGYDTYHASDVSSLNPPPNANFPYDGPGTSFATSTPALDAALNDLLNNPNNPLYHRIRDGGIVFLKAGTYVINNTVNVPPGTIIMGEGFGTKIINRTRTASISNTSAPMFRIKAETSKNFGSTPFTSDPGSDPTSKFMATRETKLYNLVIADNFVEPTFSGDTSYQQPQNQSVSTSIASGSNGQSLPQVIINVFSTNGFPTSGTISVITNFGSQIVSYTGTTPTTFTGCSGGSGTMSTNNSVGGSYPLVSVEEGAYFSCELVRFIGRVVYSGPNVQALTAYAIKTDPIVPVATGTAVTVKNCFFDGFSQLVNTTSLGGQFDYFTFVNNYARTYGFLNGDTSSNANNTFFNLTSANTNIQSNYLYANTAVSGTDTVLSLVWLNDGPSGALNVNQLPRISVVNNNVSTNQALSTQNTTFAFLQKSSISHLTASSNPKFTSIVFGNNYTGGNAGSDLWSVDVTGSGIPQLTIGFNSLLHKGTFVVGASPLAFDPGVINPVIQQGSTTGTPNALLIQGQATTQATTQGGNLTLGGGSGTSTNGLVSMASPVDLGYLSFTPSGGSNVLTVTQSANNIFDLQSGALSGVTLTISRAATGPGQVIVKNRTSQTVTVQWLSGTGVNVLTGNSALIGSDGTNAVALINGT